jgi:glycosyltransferase involved in cell wall biosynthesis
VEYTRVLVILGTRNGQLYLREMLESLVVQEKVKVSLLVSDDESNDETLKIVNGFVSLFEECLIIQGPNKGPKYNFMGSLNQNIVKRYSYIAFCDQDNVWDNNHLVDLVNLIKDESTPALAYSPLRVFKEKKEAQNVFIINDKLQSRVNVWFENRVAGCGIVLNSRAVDLVKRANPEKIVMHDWWANLVISNLGIVVKKNIPTVWYRIHGENYFGLPNSIQRVKVFFSTVFGGYFMPLVQFNHFCFIFKDELIENASPNSLQLTPQKPRIKFVDEIGIRLMILLKFNQLK